MAATCGICDKPVNPAEDVWLGDPGWWFEGEPVSDSRPARTFYHRGDCFEKARPAIEAAWGAPVRIGPSPVDGQPTVLFADVTDERRAVVRELAAQASADASILLAPGEYGPESRYQVAPEHQELAVKINALLDEAGEDAVGDIVTLAMHRFMYPELWRETARLE